VGVDKIVFQTSFHYLRNVSTGALIILHLSTGNVKKLLVTTSLPLPVTHHDLPTKKAFEAIFIYFLVLKLIIKSLQ